MAMLNEYRPPTPDWLHITIESDAAGWGQRLRVGVRTMEADVTLLDVKLLASLHRAGVVDGGARELLQQVVERATVQLATMELEKD